MNLTLNSNCVNHCKPAPAKTAPAKTAGIMLLAAAAMFCPTVARGYDAPSSDFFPIGVWLQPITTFDSWKARGVNTVIGYWPDPSQTVQQWDSAAAKHGFEEIREPQANPALDVNIKNLMAWSQPDEPDYKQISAASLANTYTTLKKLDPQRPVYMNVAGSMALNPYIAKDGSGYKAMFQSADIVSNDIYPVSVWNRPEWIDFSKALNPKDMYNATGKRLNPGTAIDTLRPWSGGKEQMAYIETSWQGAFPTAGPTGVNPAQLRGETWDAIIHGAKGITYFPQQVVGGSVDATPANVATEITKQDALISSLGGVINSGSNATDNTLKFSNPYLEGTWRSYKGQKYLFVLNMSSATLSGLPFSTAGLTGISKMQVFGEGRNETLSQGLLTDTFQPYELHIYTSGLTTGSLPTTGGGVLPVVGTLVPEPTGASLIAGGLGSLLLRRRQRNAQVGSTK